MTTQLARRDDPGRLSVLWNQFELFGILKINSCELRENLVFLKGVILYTIEYRIFICFFFFCSRRPGVDPSWLDGPSSSLYSSLSACWPRRENSCACVFRFREQKLFEACPPAALYYCCAEESREQPGCSREQQLTEKEAAVCSGIREDGTDSWSKKEENGGPCGLSSSNPGWPVTEMPLTP